MVYVWFDAQSMLYVLSRLPDVFQLILSAFAANGAVAANSATTAATRLIASDRFRLRETLFTIVSLCCPISRVYLSFMLVCFAICVCFIASVVVCSFLDYRSLSLGLSGWSWCGRPPRSFSSRSNPSFITSTTCSGFMSASPSISMYPCLG